MDDDDITRAANARKGSPFLTTEQAGRYIALSGRGARKDAAARRRSTFSQAWPLRPLSHR